MRIYIRTTDRFTILRYAATVERRLREAFPSAKISLKRDICGRLTLMVELPINDSRVRLDVCRIAREVIPSPVRCVLGRK